MLTSSHLQKVAGLLEELYGKELALEYYPKLCVILDRYRDNTVIREKCEKYGNKPHLTEKDSVVITYADTITQPGEKPLETLKKFLKTYIGDAVNVVHILPFFPSSSDAGFAVTDYRMVNPALGDWSDIAAIGKDYRIMADLVLNHVSAKSEWFQKFLKGDPKYQCYFMTFDEEIDTSKVHHPREHPLLMKVDTAWGPKYVWTTFSPDQIDLNYHCPDVLLEMTDILLHLFAHGIEMIRLDALAYIWDDPATQSVHLPQTHAIIKLLRAVVEEVVPYGVLVSETVFPFQENIQYLGTEHDESHMVTAFHLPPLVVDAFLRKDTMLLSKFFTEEAMCQECLFFNLLATHDGIPLQGIEDYLPNERMDQMAGELVEKDAFVSYKMIASKRLPYEMNITYYDAINDPDVDSEEGVRRFLASQSIMLGMKGMPGIYIGSFLADRNDLELVKRTGAKRDINRSKYSWDEIERELSDLTGRRRRCLEGMRRLLSIRKEHPQFDPHAHQTVLPMDKHLFVVERQSEGEKITVVININGKTVSLKDFKGAQDLLSGKTFVGKVEPYGVYFLK